MQSLPNDIWGHIYEFDPTYHHTFKQVMCHIRLTGARKIRLRREIHRLQMDSELVVQAWKPFHLRLTITFRGCNYHFHIPPDYPFEAPQVELDGKRFRPFDPWSPVACLMTVLLTCDVDRSTLSTEERCDETPKN